MKMHGNKATLRWAAIAFAAGLAAVSCDLNGTREDPDPVINVKTNPLASSAGEMFISVNAVGPWTIESDSEWLSVEPSEGTGSNEAVVLSFQANDEEDARTANLTIKAGGKSSLKAIVQDGRKSSGGGIVPPVVDPEGHLYIDAGRFPTAGPKWLELPATSASDGLEFFYHFMTISGKVRRNYSYYWDYKNLVAPWVAYPLNRGLISSGTRSNKWGMDPLLNRNEQPVIFSAYRGGYTRGHQIPSADRYQYDANVATFYGTNMTPQNFDFNGEVWADLEDRVRGWAKSSDTLYVVTGCDIKGSTEKAYDNDGKAVTVPVGYWKAVLRYSKGSTIGVSGSDYNACAVYLDHYMNPYTPITTVLGNAGMFMSIDDLENKLGIDLFVNLESIVGKSVADQVEAQNPRNLSWWTSTTGY